MPNIVYIATSLDGYIADENNEIKWLESFPNPDNSDMGFNEHMERIDALIMGRNTLEKVMSFDCDWPYSKPVFVLSNTMNRIPEGYEGKIELIKGSLHEIITELTNKGFSNLYIDGGKTIQSFLKEDMIDEIVISTIPVLLGNGIPLFGELEHTLKFQCISSKTFSNGVSQSKFIRSYTQT